MKKNQSLVVVLLFTITFMTARCFGQCAQVPVTPENFFTQPWQMTATGNDAKDFSFGTNMEVMVWDGVANSAGLGWNDGTFTGSIGLSDNKAIDPDVTLINCGTTIFALVVYYKVNVGYYLEQFIWNSSSFQFFSLTLLHPAPSITSPTINIDGDLSANFVIIWDDPGAAGILIRGGNCTGAGPSLCTGPWIIPVTTGGRQPDVSIYSRTGVVPIAHYTYLGSNNTTIFIAYDLISNICGTGPLNVPEYQLSIAPPGKYVTPRIATPPGGFGSTSDWSVAVIQDFNPGPKHAINITRLNTTTLSTNLTSVGNVFCPAGIGPNWRPAISYDSRYGGITECWFTLGLTGYSLGTCVAVYLGVNGSPVSAKYLIIPKVPNPNLRISDGVSIAGRDHNQMMYTFVSNEPGKQVLYKDRPFGIIPLRMGEGDEAPITLFPNPTRDTWSLRLGSDEFFTLAVMDFTGRVLLSTSGNESQLNVQLNEFSGDLLSGTYLINIRSVDLKLNSTFPAIKLK